MSQIRIDNQKAMKKWSPVLENMGVSGDRLEWMSEYAEFHSINENAYVNATNVTGMGAVVNPVLGGPAGTTLANTGWTGQAGSGDVGQNLLPVAMKIAAQTIGLDLVAVKPTPGPKLDLLYIDFQYDDLDVTLDRPQVFKFTNSGSGKDTLIIAGLTAALAGTTPKIVQTQGGLQGGRVFVNINTGSIQYTEPTGVVGDSRLNWVEFLGFSRIDNLPMFRAFRQANTGGQFINFGYVEEKNTFGSTQSMKESIVNVAGVTFSNTALTTIELVSALEDHIPGFSANWAAQPANTASGAYPMSRLEDDQSYSGVIGPKISSKTIAVGTIEISSALRRTEIEDIKANTGMDIVQKMESILVNELSQTISKQIVAKIFEMGSLNAANAPKDSTGARSLFDLNTAYAYGNTSPGGETTHAIQRKLITRIAHASNYIATEGRVGPAQYLITNGGLAAALQDIAGYTINPVKSKMNSQGQLYPVGSIGDISIYVDPYMRYNDNRIVLGRKNNPDQPGIIFVPYLMAQSISVISEATFAPRMLLRSRYAVAEVGWYPQKQFMTITVTDAAQLLN
jgi:nicotinamide mononucleotide (NMN) deamidase PncC